MARVMAAKHGLRPAVRLSSYFMALLSVASIAAIWSILSLISGGFGGYMALVVAVVIVLLLHSFAFEAGLGRALFASVLMGLSVLYQGYLFAAGILAGEMGYSLSESVRIIGLELAVAIFRGRTENVELICYGVALLVAFLLGLLLGRRG
jgi:hypothetical protein